ncbi:amino acid transporter AVT3B [Populus alba x Populus x berolinensis]|nr:amino acid transporter AVT3B [Populus alba x Populus x berolinensis]
MGFGREKASSSAKTFPPREDTPLIAKSRLYHLNRSLLQMSSLLLSVLVFLVSLMLSNAQLGLNSIATLTHLAPLSIFADVVDLAAMGVVIVKDVFIIMENRPEVRAFGGLSVFFYGMGVAVYAFEGIGMVLPIESEMREREKFGRILGLSMGLISDIITANLGPGLISLLVQLGLCINLFFTFPLMMNPVYEILERRFWGGRYCLWLRWLSVLLVTLVALMVPNFADFMSLVGSSVCCGLGFVLPALFHLLVFKEEMSWRGWSIDVGIVALGLVLAVSGTWYALMEIFAVKNMATVNYCRKRVPIPILLQTSCVITISSLRNYLVDLEIIQFLFVKKKKLCEGIVSMLGQRTAFDIYRLLELDLGVFVIAMKLFRTAPSF